VIFFDFFPVFCDIVMILLQTSAGFMSAYELTLLKKTKIRVFARKNGRFGHFN
jgi:hypothetical protein